MPLLGLASFTQNPWREKSPDLVDDYWQAQQASTDERDTHHQREDFLRKEMTGLCIRIPSWQPFGCQRPQFETENETNGRCKQKRN
ncbi:MAG: hypothetical protein AAFN51_12905, partial [Pseudomonadota bacterium]